MTLSQLKKFIKSAKKHDRWWVAVGENVLDDPQTMPEIKALAEKYPDWEICMLHEDQTDEDGAEWILLTEEEVEGERNPFRPAGPIEIMQKSIVKLEADLKDAHRIAEILKEFLEFNETYQTRRSELDDRERYLAESEDALMEKAQRLEELRVELEHKQERQMRSA